MHNLLTESQPKPKKRWFSATVILLLREKSINSASSIYEPRNLNSNFLYLNIFIELFQLDWN